MNLLSLIIPQTVFKTSSKFSGEIKVIDHVFERRLVVGGLTQSGGIVKGMWEKALKQFPISNFQFPIKNILVLGLGAGTAVEVINKKWLDAHIVGVEIDPVIIDIGKKYFQLAEIKNLEIIIGDAIAVLNHQSSILNHKSFDMIIVDLYKGKEIEKEFQNEVFLQKLAAFLSKNGIVIFNVISSQTNNFEAKDFLDKLSRIFKDNFCKRIIINDFFFCGTPI